MGVYIFLIVFLAILALWEKKTSNQVSRKNKNECPNIAFLIGVAVITVLSALRYDVGADCLTYYNNYESIVEGDILAQALYEPGTILLYRLLGIFFLSPQAFIIATSLIINILIGVRLYRSSPYPILSLYLYLTLYYYFISLNVIRQFVAISMIFYGIDYLFKDGLKNKVVFVIICVIASTFHSTGLFGLLYFMVYKIKQSGIVKFAILISAVVFYVSGKYFENAIFSVFHDYDLYSDYGREGSTNTLIVMMMSLLFISWSFEKQLIKKVADYHFYENCIAAGLLLNCIGTSNIMFSRFSYLFVINLLIFFPIIVLHTSNLIHKRTYSKMLIIGISFAYCILNLLINNASVVPYNLCDL